MQFYAKTAAGQEYKPGCRIVSNSESGNMHERDPPGGNDCTGWDYVAY